MIPGAVSRRYAEAVFDIGVEKHDVDTWLQDLRTIAQYFGDRRLAFVLSEPNISFERKRSVVQDLLQGKVQHDALGLALLLVERGLVSQAGRILDQYEKRYNDYHNQAVATVTTALPLDDQTRGQVQRELEQVTGKKILLQEKIDPSILGGVIAQVGDMLIDSSVRYRLGKLRQQIIQGGGSFGGSSDGRGPQPSGPAGGPSGGPGTGSAPGGGQGSSPAAPSAPTTPAAPTSNGSGPTGAQQAGMQASSSLTTGMRSSQGTAHQGPRAPEPAFVVAQRPDASDAGNTSTTRGQAERRDNTHGNNRNRRGKGRRR